MVLTLLGRLLIGPAGAGAVGSPAPDMADRHVESGPHRSDVASDLGEQLAALKGGHDADGERLGIRLAAQQAVGPHSLQPGREQVGPRLITLGQRGWSMFWAG